MRVKRLIRLMLSALLIYWMTMGGLLASHAYTKGWIFADFDSINAKSAVNMLTTGKDIILLDVRTTGEYKEKHLQDAIHIPVQNLAKHVAKLDKHKQILVYCRSGNRSVKASRILKKHAFTPINVKGGMQQLIREDAILTQ